MDYFIYLCFIPVCYLVFTCIYLTDYGTPVIVMNDADTLNKPRVCVFTWLLPDYDSYLAC